MNYCPQLQDPITTIHTPNGTRQLNASDFQTALNNTSPASCSRRTYLRPDEAGSVLPWLYTVFVLVLHLPVVITRVARWERVQSLSLILALISIIITVQAYTATGLKPENVLVWMPLTIPLDVGAMMQLFILILEQPHITMPRVRRAFSNMYFKSRKRSKPPLTPDLLNEGPSAEKGGQDHHGQVQDSSSNAMAGYDPLKTAAPATETTQFIQQEISRLDSIEPTITNQSFQVSQTRSNTMQTDDAIKDEKIIRETFIALLALVMFLILIALQIVGLRTADKARRLKDINASWCSTIFMPFAVAVQDGNCHRYSVKGSASKGIGCIYLPGELQQFWITGSLITISFSVAFEVIDFLILCLVNSSTRWRKVKMQRPWMTMFGGIIILVILIAFGVFNASRLPKGITESVWIYHVEPTMGTLSICRGELTSAGLRGSIIGWTDGILGSWDEVYYGA